MSMYVAFYNVLVVERSVFRVSGHYLHANVISDVIQSQYVGCEVSQMYVKGFLINLVQHCHRQMKAFSKDDVHTNTDLSSGDSES